MSSPFASLRQRTAPHGAGTLETLSSGRRCPDRERSVEQYLPLVAAIRGRLAATLPDHVDADDLYSAGLVGLFQALRNYNPACGTSRTTQRPASGARYRRVALAGWSAAHSSREGAQASGRDDRAGTKLGRTPTEAEMARA